VAVALAFAASVAYGVANYVGPRLSRNAPALVVVAAGQLVAFVISLTMVLAFGTDDAGPEELVAGLLAGVGNGLGLLLFYRAAKVGPLSIVAPIGALGTIVPVAVGLAQGEPATLLKLMGIALAIGGVVLATGGSGSSEEGHDVRAGAIWAGASALAFGLFLTEMAPAAQGGVFFATASSRATLLAIVVAAALVLGNSLSAPRAQLPRLAIPGLLLFCGTLAYAAATQVGELSIVSVIGSLFPIVTVGLAFALDRERLSPAQAAGVLAAIVGVVLLSVH
jgi:drug/metabolite transporter (DMT)-like permease